MELKRNSPMDTILYVGDSQDIKELLYESGRKIDPVQNGMIALNAVSESQNRYQAVIIENDLPLMDPSNLIKQIKHYTKIPMITVVRTDKRRNEILHDFQAGLSGWFEPNKSSIENFNMLLENCAGFHQFTNGLSKTQRSQITPHGLGTILGISETMQKIYNLLLQIQEKDVITILYGESGTGKNLTAKFMHDTSRRRKKPLISVNCPAIPSELLESELFGHERGAFTGATEAKIGRFERAEGGSIFLDEIGELNPSIQVKLLRVIQTREIERLGGTELKKVDVRIIAATHVDLENAVAQGHFREDLFYRLNVFPIYAPPLLDRKSDILLLSDSFLEKYARKHSKEMKRISTPAIDMLMRYHWPGNVRELEKYGYIIRRKN